MGQRSKEVPAERKREASTNVLNLLIYHFLNMRTGCTLELLVQCLPTILVLRSVHSVPCTLCTKRLCFNAPCVFL